jgi:hypothetical protein
MSEPNVADERSGLARIAGGDLAEIRELRGQLSVFARGTDDPQLRELTADVLAGRRKLRELLTDPGFNAVLNRRLDNVSAGLDRLTDHERELVWNRDRPPVSDEDLAEGQDRLARGLPWRDRA